jgi:outer membrane protein assembly factor BamB
MPTSLMIFPERKQRNRPRRRGRPAISLLLTCVLGAASAFASDWPHWRGPTRNGVSAETQWLDQWPADGPKIAWKAKVGLGFSSFAVAAGRVVTMGHASGKDTVFCFDAATGQELWRHSYPAELGDKYFEGGTTGSPTIADGRVYAVSRWGDAFCFEAASGKIVWSKNVRRESGARVPDWGFTGAPLVHEELLVLNVGEAGLALEKATGKIVWKSADDDAGYSTPLPVKRGGETLALFGNGKAYVAVNVRTGREAWRFRWLTQYGVNAADPVVDGDRVFISSGYGKGAVLVDVAGAVPNEIWKSKVLRTQLNAAVLHDGHLYGVDGDTTDKAALKCVEFATGKEKWARAGFGSGGVIIADNKLIALGGTGELLVAPATPAGFTPTARAQVLGGKCWTAPVLADGIVYARNSRGDVVAVNLRKP